MPCGGCAQRREAIAAAVAALRAGNTDDAKGRIAFVASSAVVDAKALAARSLQAARSRLAR
jgi:hypothetical protein